MIFDMVRNKWMSESCFRHIVILLTVTLNCHVNVVSFIKEIGEKNKDSYVYRTETVHYQVDVHTE